MQNADSEIVEKRVLRMLQRTEEKEKALGTAIMVSDYCPYVKEMLEDIERLRNNILYALEAGILAKAAKCRAMVAEYVKKVHNLYVMTYMAVGCAAS